MEKLNAVNNLGQMASFGSTTPENIVSLQLDVSEILDQIYHLLCGHQVGRTEEGHEIWVEPDDDNLKILSDYGVRLLMGIIRAYINKNTLLSWYDRPMIDIKMKNFGEELADMIFVESENVFHYPREEELFEKLKPSWERERRRRLTEDDEDELRIHCRSISQEEKRKKEVKYPMLIRWILDTVHSTYMRAYNGEERRSLRKTVNVLENLKPNEQPQIIKPKVNLVKPSTW